jgi:hypothetical protein
LTGLENQAMSLKSLHNGKAPTASRSVSLRLANGNIERLQARAQTLSASITGVARDLILTALAGGDSKSQADRLMAIERRLVALEGLAGTVLAQSERIEATTRELHTKFDALPIALSSGDGGARRPVGSR